MSILKSAARSACVLLVAVALFNFESVASAQQIKSGYICNKSGESVRLAFAIHKMCLSQLNGVQVHAYCTTHNGWVDVAPGACTGATGNAGAEAIGFAYSGSGTVWQGSNSLAVFLLCADSQSGFYFRNSVFSVDGSTFGQFISYDCRQGDWRQGFQLNMEDAQRTTDLLPGGMVQRR